MGKKHLKYSLDQKCFFSALLVCQNMKSFEGSFNFLHKLCSFDFPTDMWCILYLRVFIANTCAIFPWKIKSRAFFGKKCRLKMKSRKKAEGPIVRHNPFEWGLCVTKGCSRNDSGWKKWKRREWADTGFLYLSWSPSVHQSCSVRPPVRFPSAVAVWFWLSPTIQLTNQLTNQISDQLTDQPNKWPSADLAEESSDSSVSIHS